MKRFKGIGSEEHFIFKDEKSFKCFSLLSSERKEQDDTTYRSINNEILTYLENVWQVKKHFSGTYRENYKHFRENEEWRGKRPLERFDRQPLSDYKRWEDCGELHDLSYEARRDFPAGPWDGNPGLFLPEKVLET